MDILPIHFSPLRGGGSVLISPTAGKPLAGGTETKPMAFPAHGPRGSGDEEKRTRKGFRGVPWRGLGGSHNGNYGNQASGGTEGEQACRRVRDFISGGAEIPFQTSQRLGRQASQIR